MAPSATKHGLAVAEKWALSFHALAQEVRALPRAKQHLRLITRFRLLDDIRHELAQAASTAGLNEQRFQQWWSEESEADLNA